MPLGGNVGAITMFPIIEIMACLAMLLSAIMSPMFKVTMKGSGWTTNYLRAAEKGADGIMGLDVGIFEGRYPPSRGLGQAFPAGAPVAFVAELLDEGSGEGTRDDPGLPIGSTDLGAEIPARPFLQNSVAKLKAGLSTQVRRALITRKLEVPDANFKRVGEWAVDVIKSEIVNGSYRPNAPYTIAKKGSGRPLRDTGRLLESIRYRPSHSRKTARRHTYGTFFGTQSLRERLGDKYAIRRSNPFRDPGSLGLSRPQKV